ncbi:MAG: phosphotransferase [Pseudomonadota bacterium]
MTSASPKSKAEAETSSSRDDRMQKRDAFLAASDWGDATLSPIAGDASTRAYQRLEKNGRRAVLMDAPRAAETAPCPRDADPAQRRQLGYNATARLAGPDLNAFIAVSETLRAAGLAAPEVYAANPSEGFALLEDLGDELLVKAAADPKSGIDEATLYDYAVDVLTELRRAAPDAPEKDGYVMLDYDETAMLAEAALLPEWYAPHRGERSFSAAEMSALDRAWREALSSLAAPSVIVLRDFHAENLLWLPKNQGVKRLGVIDFQDGLFGHPAYDLVSLLEDARRDVSPTIVTRAFDRYVRLAQEDGAFDEKAFARDYAILGAQRNAKILGIFARLIVRDGKTRYHDFFERVENHLRGDLRHPALAGVRDALKGATPALTQ